MQCYAEITLFTLYDNNVCVEHGHLAKSLVKTLIMCQRVFPLF